MTEIIGRGDPRYIEEVDSALLDYVDADGVPWWFHTRDLILEELEFQLKGDKRPAGSARSAGLPAIVYMAKAFFKNLKKHAYMKDSAIIFDVSTRYDRIGSGGGETNVFADDLALETPEVAFVYENAPLDWRWPIRRNNERCGSSAPNWAFSLLLARIHVFFRRPPASFLAFTKHILAWVQREYGDAVSMHKLDDAIRRSFLFFLASNYRGKRAFKKIRSRTKLVIMIGGIYARNTRYVTKLKDSGIIVAEIQHGVFPACSPLYSPAPRLVSDRRFKRGKPDYWLLYGSWWSQQTTLPCIPIVLGNPYRSRKIAQLPVQTRDSVLIIGRAANTAKYLDLACELSIAVPELRVLFRPHPSERRAALQCAKDYPMVEIDERELYDSLSRCYAVVGEFSTVLYEAVGIADRIFVWNTACSKTAMPVCPFETFNGCDDLVKALDSNHGQPYVPQDIWSDHWRQKYKDFLREVLSSDSRHTTGY